MSRFGDHALEVTTAEFVLVPDVSHGARCWDLVVPPLERPAPVRRTFIRCLHDAAGSPAKAAACAARLGVTPIDLDTAPGPMLSAPVAQVRVLRSL